MYQGSWSCLATPSSVDWLLPSSRASPWAEFRGKRQRLLIGVPPKPLQESFPHFASMTIAELGLKAFKLEDTWEEMVADLRATRASFASLASVLACKKTLQDNFEFLLDSAKSLLKARAMAMDASETAGCSRCFQSSLATRGSKHERCQIGTLCCLHAPSSSCEGGGWISNPISTAGREDESLQERS